jgi:histidinol dehydrogenase
MKTIRYTDTDFDSQISAACAASSMFNASIEEAVRKVIEEVRLLGDTALIGLTERFDKVALKPKQLTVTEPVPSVSSELKKAFALAQKNVAAFARQSLQKNWEMQNAQGARVGEKFDPFHRVGVYIPGGTAPLVSTSLMTISLAKVAGCEEIVVCTPPNKAYPDLINPDLHYAVVEAGATSVHRVGGAQAIAALAFGTNSIKRVQKVFGPGNAYVVAAKRLLYGYLAVDLLPGPSELLVIADKSADPRFIAADMIAQAEHGSGHERVWLVTNTESIIKETLAEIERQTKLRARADYVRKALDDLGVCVLVEDMDQAVAVTNQFAPEHLEVMTRDPRQLARKLTTAGAIFLGAHSPTVVGDYVAGPSHVLPTGGAGALFAGLTVDQFQRRTSLIQYTPEALKNSLAALEQFALVEGLEGHGASARIRFERN